MNASLEHQPPLDLRDLIIDVLRHRAGKDERAAKPHDWYTATVLSLRDKVIDRWMESTRRTYADGGKRVYYLSLEFLIGRLLRDALSNLDLTREMSSALRTFGLDLAALEELEPDAALGNGGLGRLAACFMESLASLDIPAYGYGIRYVNGMFRQRIDNGWQVELPETWLSHGNPWEFDRRESAYRIGFGGEIAEANDGVVWKPAETIEASAVDTPVVGWRGKRVNTLRLWTAHALDPIRLDAFNAGDHVGALENEARADSLVRVLYPADSSAAGQELRLRQEYFFTSASIQDIVRRHTQYEKDIRSLPDKAAIQLNDTHPAVAVAELMRLLVDSHGLEFDEAWDITRRTIAYTNHTLLPEALESWPLPLFERLLPRHMQIIYAINSRVLRDARKAGMEADRHACRNGPGRGEQQRCVDTQKGSQRAKQNLEEFGTLYLVEQRQGVQRCIENAAKNNNEGKGAKCGIPAFATPTVRWGETTRDLRVPLTVLCKITDPPAPAEVIAAADSLTFRDIITVNVMFKKRQISVDTWVYVHDKNILFGRFHEPKNWSPAMVPSDEYTSLVIEYFCSFGDHIWEMTEEELVENAVDHLVNDLKFIDRSEVIGGFTIRAPRASPHTALAMRTLVRPLAVLVAPVHCTLLSTLRAGSISRLWGANMVVTLPVVNRIAGKFRSWVAWSHICIQPS